ncbi:MAG: hypothetical protein ACK4YL_08095 [Microcystis sp.]|uniref:Uncharacterized protein n=2 Tax=Microcystis TaxID=1125 RepID=A0A841UQL6_MICAE|nr:MULTISPECIES: hypothetical protein [Microcystis]MCZ8057913.1 hypothetical protein [Microcystis sp. LE19-12.2C]MDJ0547559.1 hypothetical protein [Microcystis sp. M49637_WE12]MBC1191089.1 hypothetical protein [Microcystis aeruginosa BLCC-F108]MBD2599867.1 hypothetical protein [Microcystis viridis FACHB-1342]MBE9243697.1 hypothetical protein [Microcystis aeruginosa LEGE 00239]
MVISLMTVNGDRIWGSFAVPILPTPTKQQSSISYHSSDIETIGEVRAKIN